MKTFRLAMIGAAGAAFILLGFGAIAIAANGQPGDNPVSVAMQSDTTPTPEATATQPSPTAPPATVIPPAANVPPAPVITSVQTIDDPARAVPIDNQPHKIAAHSATWFSFNYGPTDNNGNRVTNTITLVNGFNSRVRFEVWTADHMLDWWNGNKPVGQGTVNNVDCGTNQSSDTGACQSTDLTWAGAFNVGGTYFVRVVNDNNDAAIFTLTIN